LLFDDLLAFEKFTMKTNVSGKATRHLFLQVIACVVMSSTEWQDRCKIMLKLRLPIIAFTTGGDFGQIASPSL
jgi:hypothetical protein